jgi:hypothetical protein
MGCGGVGEMGEIGYALEATQERHADNEISRDFSRSAFFGDDCTGYSQLVWTANVDWNIVRSQRVTDGPRCERWARVVNWIDGHD